ncbi:ribonuclease HI family protein [Candidatus Acetothermia bacterium]|nr:ribonuclease HI family protein [Candidatus Acetothermia bacterium]MBI3643483.1 ribonuclease HI family protein [Candidatus Acetothermia bacterium]
MEKILINIDGACQGNPGDASIGVVINDNQGNRIEEIARYIGRTTNNVAEYKGLIAAAEAALQYMPKRAIFFMDSQLVVNQINGLYRVRQPHLNALHEQVEDLLDKLPSWEVKYVERTANWEAHRLAQRALLERGGSGEPEVKEIGFQRSSMLEKLTAAAEKLSEYDQRKLLHLAQRLLDDSGAD